MIVDTSVVIAIYDSEPDAHDLARRIRQAPERRMSAASFVEAGVVALRRERRIGLEAVRELVEELQIEVCALSPEQALIAQDAYLRFGKGIHPAGLNFGDCFAYALAAMRREPLLFKGADFAKTDIPLAIP